MSCILTSEKHINSIIMFMRKDENIKAMIGSHDRFTSEQFEDLRIKMMSVNLRAYLQNYSHRSDVLMSGYDANNKEHKYLTHLAFIKLCQSYLYQASDLTECYDLTFVKEKLKLAINIALDSFEDYKKAEWTI